MKPIKIKIHSLIDLITNSSTEIYTYSSTSVSALKDMIDEIVKSFNLTESDGSDSRPLTCDDMFIVTVMCDSSHIYSDYANETIEDNNLTYEEIKQLHADVIAGKVEKPTWFDDAEDNTDYDNFSPETFLYITPKHEKYTALAEKIKSFLYSPYHKATYNG